ncbi:MAG: DUF4197 domain-containing protein [Proteobacteria bacterium]|nr:DUF4197 domain-containing protein [Pseudomonadota bacterium]
MQNKFILRRIISFLFLISVSVLSYAAWDDFFEIFKESSTENLGATNGNDILSNDEIVSGLKEALVKGSQTAVSSLGKENGFLKHPQLKIPMPEKLQTVESGLRKLGQDKIADQFILSMNRAAEEATPKAMSIFSNTIKSMSVEDAYSILKGPDNAATEYLRKKGGDNLHQQFMPIVKQATNRVGVTEKYKALIDNLGMMSTFVDVESLDLDHYVTDKAIDGLFTLVAKEEKLIRENPAARTTDILKKVFSKY